MEGRTARWAMDCANCDLTFSTDPWDRSPYCTPRCKQMAGVIRYGRRKVSELGADRSAWPADILAAYEQRVSDVMLGGYIGISQAVRAAVIERDGGRCVLCGDPGRDVDHIADRSSKMDNLRLLCQTCHESRSGGAARVVGDAFDESAPAECDRRALAAEPERPCDTDEWPRTYGAWIRANRRALSDEELDPPPRPEPDDGLMRPELQAFLEQRARQRPTGAC